MYFDSLEDAIFLERLNRFVARVIYRGDEALCHVPNSGRLRELLVEGVRLRVRQALSERKTACSMLMVKYQGRWVMIDAHHTNSLFYEAIFENKLEAFSDARNIKREIVFGNSRFDFSFVRDGKTHFVEVKCGTLVEDGVARFPDAPTSRGTKHVRELMAAIRAGFGAYVVFVIQNPLAKSFSPNYKMDEEFCNALVEARDAGVQVLSYLCDTDESGIEIATQLDIVLDIVFDEKS